MTDARDEFDETIRRAAAEYHRPPDIVPREDMWAAIQARRSAPIALVPDDVPPLRATVEAVPRPRRGGLPARTWWGVAAAASVLLGAGIGIGRWTSRGWTSAPGAAPATAVVERGGRETSPRETSPRETSPRGDVSGAGAPMVAAVEPETPARQPHGIARAATRREAPAPRAGGTRDVDANVTYTIATLRHLTEVEALLVSFRSAAADSAVNARIATWARDLVTNTRLLLDSPAAADPRRRRLLEDLEMVLVQLVQLDGGAPARAGAVAEREMIDRSLGRGQLLTRLRSAIPAGS
jgi:hypothetical protein